MQIPSGETWTVHFLHVNVNVLFRMEAFYVFLGDMIKCPAARPLWIKTSNNKYITLFSLFNEYFKCLHLVIVQL